MNQNPINGMYAMHLVPLRDEIRFIFQLTLSKATGNEHQDHVDDFAEGIMHDLMSCLSRCPATAGYYIIQGLPTSRKPACDRITSSFQRSCKNWGITTDQAKTHLEQPGMNIYLPQKSNSDQWGQLRLLLVKLPHPLTTS